VRRFERHVVGGEDRVRRGFAFTAAIRVQSGDLYSAPQKTQNINTCQGMPDAAEASNMELYAGAPVPFRGKLRDAWERGCADGATGEGHSSASKAAAPAPATSSATSVQAAPRLTDQRSQLCIVGWNDYVAQSPVEGLAVAGAAGATVYPVDNPPGACQIFFWTDEGHTEAVIATGLALPGTNPPERWAVSPTPGQSDGSYRVRQTVRLNRDGTLSRLLDSRQAEGRLPVLGNGSTASGAARCTDSWNEAITSQSLNLPIAPAAAWVWAFPSGTCTVTFFRDANSPATPGIKCVDAPNWECDPGSDEEDSRVANARVNNDGTVKLGAPTPPKKPGGAQPSQSNAPPNTTSPKTDEIQMPVTGGARDDFRSRPSSFGFGAHTEYRNFRWSGWGSARAEGHGEVAACISGEGAGCRYEWTPVMVVLTNPGQCQGHHLYLTFTSTSYYHGVSTPFSTTLRDSPQGVCAY
jgi:hypothetical protein